MADKEVKIEVIANADYSEIESLEDLITEINNQSINVPVDNSEISNLEDEISNLEDIIAEETAYGFDTSESEAELENLKAQLEDIKTEAETPSTVDIEVPDMSLVNAQALMGLSSEMSNVGAEAEQMAQDMNTASITVGQLATQTGIAEPQMRNLIKYIDNATFPKEEAMMYVKSLNQIGVSSNNLGKSATDLDKINDAFGLGADKVNSLGQELSVLGVDMNNVSSSFNALGYANANTVGGMQNYFSFLQKYDAEFNKLGYNVDQASVIIAAATHKFGGGKAAYSGLSDALKEANGDTRALEEALDLQAGSLDNASQLTSQYEGQLQQLANEEAEHKTITQLLAAAYSDLEMDLAPVLGPLSSFMGMIGQAGSWAVGVNGLIELSNSFRKLSVIQSAITWLKELEITNKLVSLSQLELNFAFLMNPIFLVVAAVVALVAILGYLYFNNEQVRNSINALGQALMGFGQWVYNGAIYWLEQLRITLMNLWNYIFTLGGLLPANVNLTGNKIVDTILRVLLFIATLPMQLNMIFINIIAKALGFGDNFVQRMLTAGSNAVSRFMSQISSLPGRLMTELNNMLSAVGQWAATLPQKFWEAGVNAVKNFLNALGIHSPGTMQRMLIWEISEMGKRVPDESRQLLSNISNLGTGIVDSFGEPELGYNINSNSLNSDLNNVITGNNTKSKGDIIINIYGDVDSEKRIQQIKDVIQYEINWDNTTGGRTI